MVSWKQLCKSAARCILVLQVVSPYKDRPDWLFLWLVYLFLTGISQNPILRIPKNPFKVKTAVYCLNKLSILCVYKFINFSSASKKHLIVKLTIYFLSFYISGTVLHLCPSSFYKKNRSSPDDSLQYHHVVLSLFLYWSLAFVEFLDSVSIVNGIIMQKVQINILKR